MLVSLRRSSAARDIVPVDRAIPGDRIPAAPKAIIDQDDLMARLVERSSGQVAGTGLRAELLGDLREALAHGREEIRRRFLDDQSGGETCLREHSYLMDRLIVALADITVSRLYPAPNPTMAERFAIVATGGYGRGELAPFSDIDLLFLLPYKRTHRVEQTIEAILYFLWDLGLKVGHAVRTTDECLKAAKQDTTILTCLLEARPLWGDARLYEEFHRRFAKQIAAGNSRSFVEAKLAERDERHRKLGDSRYVLEPNVKDGKGGLRDLQTLGWIARYVYGVDDLAQLVEREVLTKAEVARLTKARQFLWTVRCHLHYVTNRAEERLTFDVQREIARRMGYADRDASASSTASVERFMKHYFLNAKHVGDLTRVVCSALEAGRQSAPRRGLSFLMRGQKMLDGFVIDGGRLDVADASQFRNAPIDMIRLFRTAQEHALDIHPHALMLISRSLRLIGPKLRKDPAANSLFLDILTAQRGAEATLRQMNEAGVLGRFVEDFGRIVAQMQYDMYHVFTVDEHTLLAIGTLHRIENGELRERLPHSTEVMATIQSRRALYVAMMLHDIAKGRGGDHSLLGARIARKLGPRFGLDEQETETVEWLVRHHLLMSRAALKRDIDDDKTIHDFVGVVASPERLRLLLVLTTADINAVGPGRWNAWKASLLNQLYERAMARMTGGFDAAPRDRRVRAAQEALRAALPDWDPADVDAYIAKAYPPYWLSLDTDTHAHHARMVRIAEREQRALTVETRTDRDAQITEATILTPDHPGLFSQLAGALALSGANIVEARIFTLSDGMALDVFLLQDATVGGAFDSSDKLARLSVILERSLSGAMRLDSELAKRVPALPSRTRSFSVQPRVLVDDQASRTHTVIEVNGRDRPGFLFTVTKTLTDLGLQISSAKVSTFGERAVDVFYVKDVFGLKLTHAQKIEQIRAALQHALADPDCAPASQTDGRVRRVRPRPTSQAAE